MCVKRGESRGRVGIRGTALLGAIALWNRYRCALHILLSCVNKHMSQSLVKRQLSGGLPHGFASVSITNRGQPWTGCARSACTRRNKAVFGRRQFAEARPVLENILNLQRLHDRQPKLAKTIKVPLMKPWDFAEFPRRGYIDSMKK